MIPLTRGIKRTVLGCYIIIPLAKGIQREVLGWYVIISICWLWVPHVFSYRETTYIPDKALKTKAIFILKYFIMFTLFTYVTQKPRSLHFWVDHTPTWDCTKLCNHCYHDFPTANPRLGLHCVLRSRLSVHTKRKHHQLLHCSPTWHLGQHCGLLH